MPHGTMPPKWDSSGATLSANPWSVTQRFTRTPERPDLLLFGAFADPDADASVRAVRRNAELAERADHPAFEPMDEAADVPPALVEVEHHINDPLARPVIGVTPAPARLNTGSSNGLSNSAGSALVPAVNNGGCSSSQTHSRSPTGANRRRTLLHEAQRLLIGDRRIADAPFDIGRNVHAYGDGDGHCPGKSLRISAGPA